MTEDIFEKEKINLTPEIGFNLVGIDYFADTGNQLYLVEHFETKKLKFERALEYCKENNLGSKAKLRRLKMKIDR